MERTRDAQTAQWLKAYLELYWLRPETALWRTLDALTLRDVDPGPPELDLGCGNGLNSYVRVGGELPLAIDDFLAAASPAPETFFAGATDIYDVPPPDDVSIPAPPSRIRYGLDWKPALLRKARTVRLYDQLIVADANRPLPFVDGSVTSVFSNVLYWLDAIDGALAEIARVLRPGGWATVLVPDEQLKEHYFHYKYVIRRGWAWMSALDMGRHTHIRHQYSRSEWERRFAAARLRPRDHRSYLSGRAVEIQEVGLRPLSPVLIDMANRLPATDRSDIKRRWVDYCLALALPMFTTGWLDDPSSPKTFHAYVLERA